MTQANVSALEIRRATDADVPALQAVYRDAVETLGPSAYTEEQTRAWADVATMEHVARVLLDNTTWVAELDGRIGGFCTLEPDGRVALLYVRGEHNRRGIGSALLRWTLDHSGLPSGTEFYAEASEFSVGLFRRFGFDLVQSERVVWNGAEFLRYNMRRR